jgi:aldehyde:ferredoxin oxidoreductase
VAEVQQIEPLAFDDLGHQKMELFYHEVNWKHTMDSCLICHFYPYRYSHVAEALSGVTGQDYSPRDLLAIGERAQTLSRLFNLREGFTADDDRLPSRVMKAFTEGPLAGVEITPQAFHSARLYWYSLMGWTPDGVPTAERLEKLSLTTLLDGVRVPAV